MAAVGLDSSYGRSGIWALEKQSYDRKTFCVALSEFIPQLGFQVKIRQIVTRMKREPSIRIIVTWLDGSQGRAFFKVATDDNLQGKTFILSDGLTASDAVLLKPFFKILDGSLGIQPRDHPHPAFEDHLKKIKPTKSVKTATKSIDSEDALCKANLTSYHAVT